MLILLYDFLSDVVLYISLGATSELYLVFCITILVHWVQS